jgi:hypothetical protein
METDDERFIGWNSNPPSFMSSLFDRVKCFGLLVIGCPD